MLVLLAVSLVFLIVLLVADRRKNTAVIAFQPNCPDKKAIRLANLSAALAGSVTMIPLLTIPTVYLFAQTDTTFKPAGQVIIQVINRTLYQTDGSTGRFGMYINRAHFGYSYQFAQRWTGTMVLDAGRPTVFGNLDIRDSLGNAVTTTYSYKEGSYYTTTLKFSYLEYKPASSLKIQAGGILQNHYITQEKFWGYRYILETFQDKYFGTPSADLGFIGYFSPLDWLSIDAALTNGEGFRLNQDNKGNVKYATGIDIKPSANLISRVYYDNALSPDPLRPATQQLLSGFLAYRLPGFFRIGAEYNYHVNHAFLKNLDLHGLSVFGSYEWKENCEFFGRCDLVRANIPGDIDVDGVYIPEGKAFITGVHVVPAAKISLSLSYQAWLPADDALDVGNTLALSFEFKL